MTFSRARICAILPNAINNVSLNRTELYLSSNTTHDIMIFQSYQPTQLRFIDRVVCVCVPRSRDNVSSIKARLSLTIRFIRLRHICIAMMYVYGAQVEDTEICLHEIRSEKSATIELLSINKLNS